MWLYSFGEEELRSYCRLVIENLELWLRRLINETLSQKFGSNYLESKDSKGNYLIKGEIRKEIIDRKNQNPSRYPRLIDATLLNELVDIICNPRLYNDYFKDALEEAFPNGGDEIRTFFKRIVTCRNNLSHANPISVRHAEQIICYSNDTIDSLKNFYRLKNMDKQYNVPTIIKMKDSLGNTKYCDEKNNFNKAIEGNISFVNDNKSFLYLGDTLSIEVDIDTSFDSNSYEIRWANSRLGKLGYGYKLLLNIEEKHIDSSFTIVCVVISTNTWHKFGNCDDRMYFSYKILPR